MGLKALLIVDLEGADTQARRVFDDEMDQRRWRKLKSVANAWRSTFEDSVGRVRAIEIAQCDVVEAARASGVDSISAAVQLAPEPMVEFSELVRRNV